MVLHGTVVHGTYDYRLVALSIVLAMFASYSALDLAARVTAAGHWSRVLWLAGGSVAMGSGVWSMHYMRLQLLLLPCLP